MGWLQFTDNQDNRHRITSLDTITIIRSAQDRYARRKPWWNIATMLGHFYGLVLGRVK